MHIPIYHIHITYTLYVLYIIYLPIPTNLYDTKIVLGYWNFIQCVSVTHIKVNTYIIYIYYNMACIKYTYIFIAYYY